MGGVKTSLKNTPHCILQLYIPFLDYIDVYLGTLKRRTPVIFPGTNFGSWDTHQ